MGVNRFQPMGSGAQRSPYQGQDMRAQIPQAKPMANYSNPGTPQMRWANALGNCNGGMR